MKIENNPHLIRAYSEYKQALCMVKQGLLGNAEKQRVQLTLIYRLIAGKPY